MIIERPWGTEEIIAQTPTYMGKILRRKAGTKGDRQSHLKHESHYLLEGQLLVRTPGLGKIYKPGDSWHVDAGVVHQEEALTDCVEIEIAEPTLNDRQVVESSPDAGLPSTPSEERAQMARALAVAYLKRASELLAG
jgi:quercetin dioxygenase-like cupin family protein